MKMLKKIDNIFLRIWVFLSVSAVSAFAADEFNDAANVVGQASSGGMKVFGTIMIWFFAVFLPIGCILGGMLLGYKQTKKQAEQDQDSMKIYFMIGLYALVGFFVFIIVAVIFGKALLGEMSGLTNKIINFYKAAFDSALSVK